MHSVASAADMRIAVMTAGLALVLLAGVLLNSLAKRCRQPAVMAEITAGIILGPSVLGLLPGDLPKRIFPDEVRPLLSAVAQVGLILFMFMVGWDFEKKLLRSQRGAAVAVSLTSVVLAFGLGAGLALLLYPHHSVVAGRQISYTVFVLFIGAAMSVTAFPVLARILTDHRLTNTRVGTLALAGAAIDDVLAWCMLAYISALVTADGNTRNLVQTAVLSAAYVALMFYVVRPLLAILVRRWSNTGHWRSLLMLLCAGALVSSWLTTWIGIHAIFGAFLFGFVAPREPARFLSEHLRGPLDHIGLVLLPVFFVVIGLGVDIGGLSSYHYLELAAIVAVACAGKLVGTIVPARAFGMSWAEARTLGLLMNTRGLTGLIILNAAVSLGVLDSQLFTMMVIMALVTTALAGPLLPRKPEVALPPVPESDADFVALAHLTLPDQVLVRHLRPVTRRTARSKSRTGVSS